MNRMTEGLCSYEHSTCTCTHIPLMGSYSRDKSGLLGVRVISLASDKPVSRPPQVINFLKGEGRLIGCLVGNADSVQALHPKVS